MASFYAFLCKASGTCICFSVTTTVLRTPHEFYMYYLEGDDLIVM